jgi:hypothetical protein
MHRSMTNEPSPTTRAGWALYALEEAEHTAALTASYEEILTQPPAMRQLAIASILAA